MTSTPSPSRRYSTGLPFLDFRLDGGIPAGTLLALTAPVSSQSEHLLYHLATSQPLLYLSTTNPAEVELRTAIEEAAISSPEDLEFKHASPQELLADSASSFDRIRPESFVVIDPIDRLERAEYDQYVPFINTLKERLRETDSVGVFHCLDTASPPDNRQFTLKRADTVWQLEQIARSREIDTRLLVTKARRGRALSEPIPIAISDHVRIDTSQRIG